MCKHPRHKSAPVISLTRSCKESFHHLIFFSSLSLSVLKLINIKKKKKSSDIGDSFHKCNSTTSTIRRFPCILHSSPCETATTRLSVLPSLCSQSVASVTLCFISLRCLPRFCPNDCKFLELQLQKLLFLKLHFHSNSGPLGSLRGSFDFPLQGSHSYEVKVLLGAELAILDSANSLKLTNPVICHFYTLHLADNH